MNRERIVSAANAILDRPNADPDDDAAICARYALAAAEAAPLDVEGHSPYECWPEHRRQGLNGTHLHDDNCIFCILEVEGEAQRLISEYAALAATSREGKTNRFGEPEYPDA